MNIAVAGRRDAPILAAIHAAAFAKPWSAADIGTLLAGDGVFALTASDGQLPCAFVLVRVAADESEVLTLATRPAKRRQGLARALLTTAVDRARAAGARAMILEAAEENSGALALYTDLGFRPIGRRMAYYPAGEDGGDARIMRLEL